MQIVVFYLFQCFAKKEYQMESKWNETFGRVIFGTNVIQGTWSRRQERSEEATRQGGVPTPSWSRPHPCGPLVAPPTYFFLLYIYPYTTMKPYFHHRNLLYPRDPILGPFPELRRRGHRSRKASTSTPWLLR